MLICCYNCSSWQLWSNRVEDAMTSHSAWKDSLQFLTAHFRLIIRSIRFSVLLDVGTTVPKEVLSLKSEKWSLNWFQPLGDCGSLQRSVLFTKYAQAYNWVFIFCLKSQFCNTNTSKGGSLSSVNNNTFVWHYIDWMLKKFIRLDWR